jgi:hypothetical protein
MSSLAKFWRGQLPLAKTFWLGWAVPVIGGNLFVSLTALWLMSNFGLVVFYAVVAFIIVYGVAAVVPVWRSATAYDGRKILRYAARTVAAVASAIQVVVVGVIVFTLVSLKLGIDPTHDPDRTAEKMAIPSESHPMAGFWKSSPSDNFGLAIAPAEGKLYSVSFCGPGGCFKPGTYRPDTPLVGDESYQVTSANTLLVHGQDGWITYQRAASRGEENCPPK